MLSITSAGVIFLTQFTQTIAVFTQEVDPETGEIINVPSITLPTVTRSFNDPSVAVNTAIGEVTISGLYSTIIVTNWQYIDLDGMVRLSNTTPELGTFKMITKVDSPVSLTENCVYTIDGEAFTHSVSLPSYTTIADTLKSLLATVS